MSYKNILPVITFLFIFSFSFSQQGEILEYHSTHHMSKEEKELMNNYTRDFTETPPPTGEVRNIAEWEEMESVLIAYDGGFGIPYSLIAEMSQDCGVTTIVANASEETIVTNLFSSNGVNLANCTFVHQDPDTYWTRDYSPWYIAVDDSEVAIINFPYNRPWRENDNDVPILMANELGLDLYGMNITHTGGNYMCDGYGKAASSDLVWDENTWQTQAEVHQKVLDYLGVDIYHVTLDPLGEYIKHIDCWGKFLDVDKVLITEVPSNDPRYDDYEYVANYFASQNCSWGYPYEVIRVQAVPGDVNPYTNALILNDKVFVPQTGSDLDDDALAVYETAMPGYEIHGVYSSSWINSDALHCRAHGVADREMLVIRHYPLYGDQPEQNYYTVEADVFSYGGSPISAGFPILYYQHNGGSWETVVMTNTTDNTYTADIPAINGLNEVGYYIVAENDNNVTASQPRMGTVEPHTFTYTGVVGINETLVDANIGLYPNPAKDSFTLKSAFTDGEVSIYTASGQKVYAEPLTSMKHTITLTNFAQGVYIVKIERDAASYFKKLVVE